MRYLVECPFPNQLFPRAVGPFDDVNGAEDWLHGLITNGGHVHRFISRGIAICPEGKPIADHRVRPLRDPGA